MCADRQLPFIKHKLVLLGDQSVGKTSIINRLMYDFFDSSQYQTTIGVDFFSKNITVERTLPPPPLSSTAHASSTTAGGDGGGGGGGASYEYVVKLHIWDTAGQERYRSLIPSYVRNSTAAVVVYDITSRASFLSAFTWIDEIKHALGIDTTATTTTNENSTNAVGGAKGCGGGGGGGHGTASVSNGVGSQNHNTNSSSGDCFVIMLVGNKLDMSADGAREVSAEEAERRARECGYLFCEASAMNGTNIKNLFRVVAQTLPAAAAPPQTATTGAGAAASSGVSGSAGRFGAATRDPFLVTPSMMTDADRRQAGNINSDSSSNSAAGGCC